MGITHSDREERQVRKKKQRTGGPGCLRGGAIRGRGGGGLTGGKEPRGAIQGPYQSVWRAADRGTSALKEGGTDREQAPE